MKIEDLNRLEFKGMRWDSIFTLLFACSLPFYNGFYNLVAACYGLYTIGYLVQTRQLPHSLSFESLKRTKYLIMMFLLIVISAVYSTDKANGFAIALKFITLIAMPVFFALIRISLKEKHSTLLFFIWANFLALVVNFLRATWRSFHLVNEHLTFDSSVAGGQEFWYSITQEGNFYFITEFSSFLHPTYWSMYLFISVITIVYFFRIGQFNTTRTKVVYSVILVFLILGIFMCSSRIMLLIMFLMLVIYFAVIYFKKRSYKFIGIMLVCAVMMAILFANNPRIEGPSKLKNSLSFDSRSKSWQAGLNIFTKSPVIGYGAGDAEKKLMEEYARLGYEDNIRLLLNEHNQYLQFANQTGIIGLVVFLLAIVAGFKMSVLNKSFLQFSFVFAIAIVCIVESFLARQAGITCFCFFYCFLFTVDDGENKS
jgi:O-antigen ligase